MTTTKVGLAVLLGLTMMACSGEVRIEAKSPPPPPPVQEPAPPPPPPEEPKAGEQLNLPEQIEFETNEAKIRQSPKTLATLEQLADTMKKHPKITKLRVEGHTDNVGNERRNDKLSKARAEAVAKWLSDHEVDRSRIVTVGYGAKRPLVANDSAEHRAQNRRTEYYVEELEGKKVEASTTSTTSASIPERKN